MRRNGIARLERDDVPRTAGDTRMDRADADMVKEAILRACM